MSDKPIIFSAPMVRALLDGRKTQTRRVIKPQPSSYLIDDASKRMQALERCRYAVGDRLWVREAWRTFVSLDKTAPRDLWSTGCGRGAGILYIADGGGMSLDAIGNCHIGTRDNPTAFGRHRQGMHMPRWASRLTLIVTGVRVERLQDISEADALAEGIVSWPLGFRVEISGAPIYESRSFTSATGAYRWLWDHINGPGAWTESLWVVCYSFRVIKGNIDQIGGAS